MTELWIYATLVFLFAGTIKGTVGIGLPTASVGILTQFTEPRTAIALVVFPLLITNAWQMVTAGGMLATARKYKYLLFSLVVVLGSTTFAMRYVPTDLLILALGLVVVLFAVTSLISVPPFLPDRFDHFGQIASGVTAGIIGGLTSIWGPPMAIYLLARRTGKDEFVRALGLLLFCGGIPLAFGFWANGMLAGPNALMSIGMVVPSLVGFTLGSQIRKRIDADRFRTAVLMVFLVMGLNLLRRAIF